MSSASVSDFAPAEDRTASIEVARTVLLAALDHGDEINDEIIERAAEAVHADWLTRPTHHVAPGQDERLPYPQLTEEAKEKDRVFVRIAWQEIQNDRGRV